MWNIYGHEWAIEQLRSNIRANRVAHAYLFAGPPGIGKSLLALRMAQALTCEQQTGDPCLQCRSCRRIERGNHPDVRVAGMATQAAAAKADEAARQKELKIATIREWQRDLALRPYEAARRVLILHDAERLSEEAANAMLKTLEEPPDYATLLLVAHSSELLPTIVSRCRVLRLRPLPREQVVAALQAHGASPALAAELAAWSGGRVGWAINLLADPAAQAARREQIAELIALSTQDLNAGLRWAEQRSKEYRAGEQETALAWLEVWQSWWRDVVYVAAGCDEAVTNVDRRAELAATAQRVTLAAAFAFLQQLIAAGQQLRENVNPQLAFEHLVLHLPRAA
ncbi:DNA polymerase III subunit delta' [Chloroflexus sp.]|uniref:DNA polymerase III subunit delta' n=1 Tax=Chloroflexus sp. TaxID=1904827 RepID=UPI00298EF685|nr:DNA polymerase III subunit delta' [Chloroflexus sp.]MCS6888693.1 DNA polymerase III subunit delta' [Chloroflexus sp.]MDW8405119.1 DNA polymerase III subunit delta' [Chloroflexus sp.]